MAKRFSSSRKSEDVLKFNSGQDVLKIRTIDQATIAGIVQSYREVHGNPPEAPTFEADSKSFGGGTMTATHQSTVRALTDYYDLVAYQRAVKKARFEGGLFPPRPTYEDDGVEIPHDLGTLRFSDDAEEQETYEDEALEWIDYCQRRQEYDQPLDARLLEYILREGIELLTEPDYEGLEKWEDQRKRWFFKKEETEGDEGDEEEEKVDPVDQFSQDDDPEVARKLKYIYSYVLRDPRDYERIVNAIKQKSGLGGSQRRAKAENFRRRSPRS